MMLYFYIVYGILRVDVFDKYYHCVLRGMEMFYKKARNITTILILAVILVGTLFISIGFGAVSMSTDTVSSFWHSLGNYTLGNMEFLSNDHRILYTLRLPRILEVALAGSVLSMAGVIMQTLTRNELAEPYVLGVSAGAGAGAAAAIIGGLFLWFAPYHVYVGAFLGSLLAITIVLLLVEKSRSRVGLVLVGIGVSSFFSALTTWIIYSAKNEAQVRSAMFWLVGSFSGIQWQEVIITGGIAVVLLIFTYWLRYDLDLLLLGHNNAAQLGLETEKLQYFLIVVLSLSVAIVVAQTGVIGFVGLVIPHMARRLVGPKHGSLLIVASLLGAIILSIADGVSRTYFRPEEVPVGVVTALMGAPVFIYMIKRST